MKKEIVLPPKLPKPTEVITDKMSVEEKRIVWEKQYNYWLRRKNRLGLSLQAKNIDPDSNQRYILLKKKTQEVWDLLHDSKPSFSSPYKHGLSK